MKVVKINAIWCSGCLSMKKIWKEIEEEYPNLDIINLDYDMDEEEVSKYLPGDVLPVVILKNNEKEIRLIGEKSKEEIIEKIKEINE